MSSLYNKVAWSEGILLTPQHFQQQERYFEERINQLLKWHRPFYWGFSKLILDQEALQLGKISILEANGIFKDGTSFNIPEHEPRPEPIEIAGCNQNSSIYLKLAMDSENLLSRYQCVEAEIHDSQEELVQSNKININLLKLELGFETSTTHSLQIAKIRNINSDQSIVLDEEFIAPMLQIKASSKLILDLENCIELIQLKAEPKSTSCTQLEEYYPYLLKQQYYRLNHIAKIENSHPEELYKLLLDFCGLLGIIHQSEINGLIEYQHDNPYKSLDSCFNYIKSGLMKNLSSAIELKFSKHPDGFWVSPDLEIAHLERNLSLRLKFDHKPILKIENMASHIKLGSTSCINRLIRQALPGIKLIPLATKTHPDKQYQDTYNYEICKHGEIWDLITREQKLVMHGNNLTGSYQASILIADN